MATILHIRPHGLQPFDRVLPFRSSIAECRGRFVGRTASFQMRNGYQAVQLARLPRYPDAHRTVSTHVPPAGRPPTSRKACPNPCVCAPYGDYHCGCHGGFSQAAGRRSTSSTERTASSPKVDRRLRQVKAALGSGSDYAFNKPLAEACPSVTDNLACCLSAPIQRTGALSSVAVRPPEQLVTPCRSAEVPQEIAAPS